MLQDTATTSDELKRAMSLLRLSETYGMGDLGLSLPESSIKDFGEDADVVGLALKIVNYIWKIGPLAEDYEKKNKPSYVAVLKEAGLLPKTVATTDVDAETLAKIRGTKFRMKPITAEEIYAKGFTKCKVESFSIRQYKNNSGTAEFVAITDTWKQESINHSLVTDKRQQRGLFLQAFLAASQLADIPSLYLWYPLVKDIAVKFSMWALFGFALQNYCRCLAEITVWNHLGRIQDLVYFSVAAGEAFEAAGMHKEAIANYKRAAMASVSGTGPISEDYPAMAWNCLGLALKRQGEYAMAVRAYQTALAYVLPPDKDTEDQQQNVLRNMKSLWEVMYLSSDLRIHNCKGGDKESIQIHTEKTNAKPTYANVHPCAYCGKMTKDAKKCGACLGIRYRSKDCSRADWAKHRKVCKKSPNDEAAAPLSDPID